MKKLIFILSFILAACAPSEEAIQTAIAETLTAAPTATATVTATPQPTLPKRPAAAQSTSTSALMPRQVRAELRARAARMGGLHHGRLFHFAAGGWKAADISQEGMAGVLKLIEGMDSPLTEEILETLLSGEIASMGMDGSIKFFARDASPELRQCHGGGVEPIPALTGGRQHAVHVPARHTGESRTGGGEQPVRAGAEWDGRGHV